MEKTYVFDNSGNESTGLLGSILPCLQSKGIDTGCLLGMLNNCANGGLFGGRGFEDRAFTEFYAVCICKGVVINWEDVL